MPIRIRASVEGGPELERNLERLGQALRREVLRKGIATALRPTADVASALAPRSQDPEHTKPLADSMKISTRLTRNQRRLRRLAASGTIGRSAVEVFVGPTAPHGHLVERGHLLVKGTVTAIGRGRRRVVLKDTRRVIGHVPGYPFLRPAWEQTKEQVRAGIAKGIAAEIQRVARSLPKRLLRTVRNTQRQMARRAARGR